MVQQMFAEVDFAVVLSGGINYTLIIIDCYWLYPLPAAFQTIHEFHIYVFQFISINIAIKWSTQTKAIKGC